jgi:hypothetical protein
MESVFLVGVGQGLKCKSEACSRKGSSTAMDTLFLAWL